ncbi:hypothetical protein [Sphingobacterium paucimobilis]|uniref:hypothetical protein n=1 Tax=Sphingobacterium paucimobilis TaxID=1385985 RepID=UPI001182CE7A|nr:hypothetical protein [Sphingobacterium paucimobilis]
MKTKTYHSHQVAPSMTPDRTNHTGHDLTIAVYTIAVRCRLDSAGKALAELWPVASLTVARYRRRFAVFPRRIRGKI